jgi:putative DNA primase/helicase
MKPALCEEDIDLLQRWCGVALVGSNLVQVVMLLTGMAGGGKGTFIRVLRGIIGPHNMATLRTSLLGTRFELGRFLGRTLLYGADVAPDFLNCGSAGVLKSLTGGDPMKLEFKSTNARPEIICAFNVILTSNIHLRVRLRGRGCVAPPSSDCPVRESTAGKGGRGSVGNHLGRGSVRRA